MIVRACAAIVCLVACGEPAPTPRAREPEQAPPERAQPEAVEYVACVDLGAQRFEPTFCVHAEDVRIEDVPFEICGVTVNPSSTLYAAMQAQILRTLAAEHEVAESEIEVTMTEGLRSHVTLDVCLRQDYAWPEEERVEPPPVVVVAQVAASRPMNVELLAARGFRYRVAGGPERGGQVGRWPRLTRPPPVEWQGYSSCDALPEHFSSSPVCVRAEGVRAGRRTVRLCERLTIGSSQRLRERIESRIRQHLRIGEHEDELIIDVTLSDDDYVATIEGCVALPERSLGGASARARGVLDDHRRLAVEVERARFRYRFGVAGDFQDGSIGFDERED